MNERSICDLNFHLKLFAQFLDAVGKDFDAVRGGPHLLIANQADLVDVAFRARKVVPVERDRRPSLCPELVHGEEVVDVIAEQLLKDQFRIVAGVYGPLTVRNANDVAVAVRADARVAVFGRAVGLN